MTTVPMNPFRPTRWEHQRDGFQLIWFNKTAELMSANKSIYIRGSRGSGKTTLLKSICWEDLTRNSSLRLQRTISDFDHIGLYIRFPDHISSSVAVNNWAKIYPDSPQPELQFHRFFSLLVELTCLERALIAVHELRLLGVTDFSPAQELHLVEATKEEFPALLNFSNFPPNTFVQLSRAMRILVRRMNDASGRGALKEINEGIPDREPGELLTFVTRRLTEAVRMSSAQGSKAPAFKFCLDDCEVLSDLQQKSINTLVRTSQYPVSWVISSVGSLLDNTETFIEQQPLTDADRRVIHLDRRTDEDFRDLCQAVVSLRLLFSVSEKARINHSPDNLADFFPLGDRIVGGRPGRLGSRNVNDVMEAIATKSTSPIAAAVVEAARRLQTALDTSKPAVGARRDGQRRATLPYYEAYTLLHWRGREDAFRATFPLEDVEAPLKYLTAYKKDSFQAWLRRKQRAALLHFASALGFRRLPLAGAQIVISLADGSIRDFLEIMGEIFEAYAKDRKISSADVGSLDRFATSRTTIAYDTQTEGIYAASSSYLAGVSSRAERNSDLVHRLIEGLGHYTAALQSSHDDPSTLGRAERGVFVVKFSATGPAFIGDTGPDREAAIWTTIRQAEIAGYIRAVGLRREDSGSIGEASDQRGRIVTFRLHRRFAPHFRFSYRGAYEPVSLPPMSLWPLCDSSAPADPRAWAEAQFKRTPALDEDQLSMWQMLDAAHD